MNILPVTIVSASTFLGYTDTGGSGPVTILCSYPDGTVQEVVVKFKENVQGLMVLVNEFVAGLLAQKLRLPYPKPVLVYVSPLFAHSLNYSGIMQWRTISPGLHFGTIKIKNTVYKPTKDLILKVKNISDFPRIIVFDTLTYNHDRDNEYNGNFIIVNPDHDPNCSYLSIIDHGHCFGKPNWNKNIIYDVANDTINFLPEMADKITGTEPFQQALHELTEITPAVVNKIIQSIPNEWGCTESCRKALKVFIVQRISIVERILNAHKDRFPFWR